MKLTQEQFNALSPYEKHFETAVQAQWARFPGVAALDLINETYQKITGTHMRLNKGCSYCILRLLTDMGTIYFADKAEMESVKKDLTQKVVDVKEDLTQEPVKVEVKTRKPRRKKA